ncbi:ankyrin repeat domain-containing protein [bacterium]|nr:MAG: ankyrin repeat domain-containing protein [bacterium]
MNKKFLASFLVALAFTTNALPMMPYAEAADQLTIECDNYSATYPLHHAAYAGMLNTLQKLLEGKKYGINHLDDRGRTPLQFAARFGRAECLKQLLDAKADATIADSQGYTALHWAAEMGHAGCIQQLFINRTALNVEAQTISNGYTPLHLALINGNAACAQRLVKFGLASLTMMVRDGDFANHTPLMITKTHCSDLVPLLEQEQKNRESTLHYQPHEMYDYENDESNYFVDCCFSFFMNMEQNYE